MTVQYQKNTSTCSFNAGVSKLRINAAFKSVMLNVKNVLQQMIIGFNKMDNKFNSYYQNLDV